MWQQNGQFWTSVWFENCSNFDATFVWSGSWVFSSNKSGFKCILILDVESMDLKLYEF